MSTMLAADPLPLTDEQRFELERIARSTSMPHLTVLRAQALLAAGDGVANYEIARRVGVSACLPCLLRIHCLCLTSNASSWSA
jgi:hypothetical protein